MQYFKTATIQINEKFEGKLIKLTESIGTGGSTYIVKKEVEKMI